MKKVCCLIIICMLLSGCAAAQTFETLGDVQHQQVGAAAPCEIKLELPANAQAMGNIYFCDGFYLELQTLDAGDLNATVTALSGFTTNDLTLMTAAAGSYPCYEWVWSAASEEGELICRAAVIDDGSHHYCLTAVALAEQGGALQDTWNQLFASFEAVDQPTPA